MRIQRTEPGSVALEDAMFVLDTLVKQARRLMMLPGELWRVPHNQGAWMFAADPEDSEGSAWFTRKLTTETEVFAFLAALEYDVYYRPDPQYASGMTARFREEGSDPLPWEVYVADFRGEGEALFIHASAALGDIGCRPMRKAAGVAEQPLTLVSELMS